MSEAGGRPPRIAVVADDLIWATRLVELVRRAGAEPVPVRRPADLAAALAGAAGAVVDTSGRVIDPIAALVAARAASVPSLAVAPHDDPALRRDAVAAGASRVVPYRALHERGDRELARWLAEVGVAVGPASTSPGPAASPGPAVTPAASPGSAEAIS